MSVFSYSPIAAVAPGVNLQEHCGKLGIGFELSDDLFPGGAGHFDRIERGTAGLIGQSVRTAVPELLEIQRRIKNGRCIHPSERTVHAVRVTLVIHTARMQAVARSAGNRIVGRQARIVVKHLAERRLAGSGCPGSPAKRGAVAGLL